MNDTAQPIVCLCPANEFRNCSDTECPNSGANAAEPVDEELPDLRPYLRKRSVYCHTKDGRRFVKVPDALCQAAADHIDRLQTALDQERGNRKCRMIRE